MRSDRGDGRIAAWNGLCIAAVLINSALETLVVPALPQIRATLSLTPGEAAWLFSILLSTAAVSLPLAGRLADIFGARPVIVATLICVTIGVACVAAAPSYPVMLVGQALQGPMVSLVPLSLALLRERSASGGGSAGVIAAASASAVLGMVLAGLFLEKYSYRVLFWATFAVDIMLLAGALVLMRDRSPVRRASEKVDWIGAVLLGSALGGLLLGISLIEGSLTSASAAFVLGVLLAGGAFKWFATVRDPLVDLSLLLTPQFGCVGLIQFGSGFGTFGMFIILPMIISSPPAQGGLGLSATVVSTCLLPFGVTGAISPALIPLLRGRLSSGAILLAGSVILLMTPVVALLSQSPRGLAGSAALLGTGVGIVITQSLDLLAQNMPVARVATFSALAYVLRMIGCAFGGLVVAVVAGSVGSRGFDLALYVVAATMLAPLSASFALSRINARMLAAPSGSGVGSGGMPDTRAGPFKGGH